MEQRLDKSPTAPSLKATDPSSHQPFRLCGDPAIEIGCSLGVCFGGAPNSFRAAVRQQSRLLSQRHDSTWPTLNGLLISIPRHPIVTGKGDQLLDVAIAVDPELDGIGKVEWVSRSRCTIREQNGNSSASEPPLRLGVLILSGWKWQPVCQEPFGATTVSRSRKPGTPQSCVGRASFCLVPLLPNPSV